ncbi:unnamed protein product [Periconia digitata]|uniref:HECT-type E3 ubiquitin transferase n=1 Tax=Periconia digitata TaxID=1303443 RepID=A0A9W4UCC2_9PLEO|nr:unnamed protein product [Periconia digitata]
METKDRPLVQTPSPTSSAPRVTRSAARRSAGSTDSPPNHPPAPPAPPPPASSSRKRKAPAREPTPEPASEQVQSQAVRTGRAKRTKTDPQDLPPATSSSSRKGKAKSTMSAPGRSTEGDEAKAAPPARPSSSKRNKSGRKSANPDSGNSRRPSKPSNTDVTADGSPSTSRKPHKSAPKSDDDDDDVTMADASETHPGEESQPSGSGPGRPFRSAESLAEALRAVYDDDDDEDPEEDEEDDEDDDGGLGARFLGGRHISSIQALRQITGMMGGGTHQKLRGVLEQLRSPDVSEQLVGLTELSHTLLMSSEDSLAGHFSPDAYVKELVNLMQPNDFGEDHPEVMLLACRSLANMMEALPASTANIVYGGAVPVLCSKLLEINFIDLAEQCLSTLEKISVDFPSSIVREGGLTACLTYLDFFATSTQRTAVTTAANCCRNIPSDSFSTVRDVMPILKDILNNNDQKVVEQGCMCVSRIVQSFKHQEDKLEELVSPQLLRAILRLLLPGTANMIGPNIHTQFLQVLAYTAKASPQLSAELFKMNVVDTLFQILTGVSPPADGDNVAKRIDTVVIMQALVHRPKDQVYETLNVICELLPDLPKEGLTYVQDLVDAGYPGSRQPSLSNAETSTNETRIKLLEGCKQEVRRFAVVLLPTLTDVYSSTVNLSVREKVLTAHLKMFSNLDTDILEEALRSVPYASHLASIFSQQDHPTLVTYALQAAEILLKRLEKVYRYQFYREGVISEISQLANRPAQTSISSTDDSNNTIDVESPGSGGSTSASSGGDADVEQDLADEMDADMNSGDVEDHDLDNMQIEQDDDHDDEDDDDDDDSDSSSSSGRYAPPTRETTEDTITIRAKKFIELHEKDNCKTVRDKSAQILEDIRSLATEIKQCVLQKGSGDCAQLFARLATYFQGDALESITSYELMTTNVVDVLLEIFSKPISAMEVDPRPIFLGAFMGSNVQSQAGNATPFSVLVGKLQDLLSRSEHFEVVTVHQHSYDSRGSATSMLAKQLRLKLVADESSGIPKTYRNIMVSIHAIATFKALDDYLRPRIAIAEQPRPSRTRDHVAAYAQALAEGRPSHPPPPHTPLESTNRSHSQRKSSRSKPSSSSTPSQAGPSSTSQEKPRRSTRHQQTQDPPPPPPPPMPRTTSDQDPVECADEERLSDGDSLDENSALNTIVGELEDEMEESEADPSAVSVEVASTGKVTAHKEDGTRVSTPLQTQPVTKAPPSQDRTSARSALSSLLAQSSGLRDSVGALSYAAAVQAIPQDWHIEFSINDEPIVNDTTIYRAVHFSQSSDASQRTVWNAVHTIKFKRVSGPPPSTDKKSVSPSPESKGEGAKMPGSLDKHPATSGILRLLGILHDLNANLDDLITDHREQLQISKEPASQFVNTKLTAKLNRQLEEPLIVASNCLPSWSEDLARLYPFLFPFEARHLFLQSTSFGYSRSMTRWQNSQATSDSRNDRHRDERPFLGRLQRQKVRISRSRILESAMKVMHLYGHIPSILEVEYFDEVGTGLGPTLEFYATVSREFSKKKLKLWRENESNPDDEYAFGKRGLFPAPMSAKEAEEENGKKVLELFRVLGKFAARSMLDSRIIDVSFNPTFFRVGDGNTAVAPSLGTVKSVDHDLAQSLQLLKQFADEKKRIDEDVKLDAAQKAQARSNVVISDCRMEDLGLDFTLPGYPIDLIEGGHDVPVTMDNVDQYMEAVLDATLGSGVQRQVDAFRAGFSEVFPYSALNAFTPAELVMLFGRVEEDWSLETLMDSIKTDHGFNLDSKSIRNLLQVMSEYTPSQRRDFLQFITGSPKLPIGGFKSLTPMFTVVNKRPDLPYTPDDYLPSVMTCVNYLKMPDYSSIDVLRARLGVAVNEGQGAFHLS